MDRNNSFAGYIGCPNLSAIMKNDATKFILFLKVTNGVSKSMEGSPLNQGLRDRR